MLGLFMGSAALSFAATYIHNRISEATRETQPLALVFIVLSLASFIIITFVSPPYGPAKIARQLFSDQFATIILGIVFGHLLALEYIYQRAPTPSPLAPVRWFFVDFRARALLVVSVLLLGLLIYPLSGRLYAVGSVSTPFLEITFASLQGTIDIELQDTDPDDRRQFALARFYERLPESIKLDQEIAAFLAKSHNDPSRAEVTRYEYLDRFVSHGTLFFINCVLAARESGVGDRALQAFVTDPYFHFVRFVKSSMLDENAKATDFFWTYYDSLQVQASKLFLQTGDSRCRVRTGPIAEAEEVRQSFDISIVGKDPYLLTIGAWMLRSLENDNAAMKLIDDFKEIGDKDINFNIVYWDTLLSTNADFEHRLKAAEKIVFLVGTQREEIAEASSEKDRRVTRYIARADLALIAFTNDMVYEITRAIALNKVDMLPYEKRLDQGIEFLGGFSLSEVRNIFVQRFPDRNLSDNLREAAILYATIRDTLGYSRLVVATRPQETSPTLALSRETPDYRESRPRAPRGTGSRARGDGAASSPTTQRNCRARPARRTCAQGAR